MYEFNGWAVVRSDEGSDEADGALFARLLEQIAGLPEMTRDRFHWDEGTLNGHWAILVSGLRNHGDPFVRGVFQWLADHSRRSYGLLHTRGDSWGEPDRFEAWRLRDGELTLHEDPFFS
jgi:hypothetical protein